MMMTKPAPVAETTATDTNSIKPKSSPADAVKDLERRLQMLETTKPPTETTSNLSVAASPAPTTSAPPAAATAAKTGKNALLARIMAAQERAKQPTTADEASPADLLDSFDAPLESELAPPPPFDASLLPIQAPPPAFDEAALPPPPVEETSQSAPPFPSFDPMHQTPAAPVSAAAPPAASAPVFEDLLDSAEDQKAPPSYDVTPVAPPSGGQQQSASAGIDQEAINAILGIEGLSDEEKAAMIADQEKIMASIEAEKKNKAPASSTAASRADAFEQRSHAAAVQAIGSPSRTLSTSTRGSPATATKVDLGDGTQVALHGAAKTHEAIKDGTAVMVVCLSCENWMQVTGHATLMFCPICQTVSPVAAKEEKELATQMATDMELAEQLQKEEYKKANKATEAARQKAIEKEKAPEAAKVTEQSWMDWLGFGSSTTSTTNASSSPDRSFAQRPLERGQIGVSLPPGASRNNTALAMAPAYTGQDDDVDTPNFSPSRESESLMANDEGVGGGEARMAEQKPLFSCVAESISEAANQFYTTVNSDGEGNVHGVDGSGLLAMSQAGRNSSSEQGYRNMD